jgi:hypothetical protein
VYGCICCPPAATTPANTTTTTAIGAYSLRIFFLFSLGVRLFRDKAFSGIPWTEIAPSGRLHLKERRPETNFNKTTPFPKML